MVTRLKLSAVLMCAGLVACAAAEPNDASGYELNLDTASEVSALEVDEDGADEEFADATGEEPVLDRECSLEGRKERLREQYDQDGDGALNEDERAALREDFGEGHGRARHAVRKHRRLMLARLYDADRSRDLDAMERAELRADLAARLAARQAQRLAKYDADQSGDLDAAEWERFVTDVKARFQARHAKLLEAFDHDSDGKLNIDERFEARAAMGERLEQRREALEAEFDTNGDGVLDADERTGLVEALKARVRGEHFGQP